MGTKRVSPRSRSPVNWYVNYGYDTQKATKGNPVYSDLLPENDMSRARSDSGDSTGRPRAFSNITEEDDVFEHSDATKQTSNGADPDKEVDRLSEIYIDVETNSEHSSIYAKQRPYMKEFDAMNGR